MFEGTVVWKVKFDASMGKEIKIVKKIQFQLKLNFKVSDCTTDNPISDI